MGTGCGMELTTHLGDSVAFEVEDHRSGPPIGISAIHVSAFAKMRSMCCKDCLYEQRCEHERQCALCQLVDLQICSCCMQSTSVVATLVAEQS